MKNVTIFGGAFDPIHYAHLIIAQEILEKTESPEILFLPSFSPPHKKIFAPFCDRVNMLNLAIGDNPQFQCSDMEKHFTQPSYTIDSLRAIKKRLGVSDISFIIGMDSAVEFETWKEPDTLLFEFKILVIKRLRFTKEDILPRFQKKMHFIDTRRIEISSTEIRERIKKCKNIRYLTPPPVIDYIIEKGFYR